MTYEFNISGDIYGSQLGGGTVNNFGAGPVPAEVLAALSGLQQEVESSSPAALPAVQKLDAEVKAKEPVRDRILKRIATVTALAGATGGIAKAAEALESAVRAWH